MQAIIKLSLLALVVGSCTALRSLRAVDAPVAPLYSGVTNRGSFKATVRYEEGPGLAPVTRAYLNVGTNKLGFEIPPEFRADI